MKTSKVCIATKSTLVSLLYKRLATKHTTAVKCTIKNKNALDFQFKKIEIKVYVKSIIHNISKMSASVSSGFPNMRKQMKAQVLLLFLSVWKPR